MREVLNEEVTSMAILDIFNVKSYKSALTNITEENESLKIEIARLKTQVDTLNSDLRSKEKEYKRLEDYVHSFLPLFDAGRLSIPANYETLKKLWCKWGGEIHTMNAQIARQIRARSEILTPIALDPDFAYGKFHGHQSDYQTHLTYCECKDFQIRSLPCKHIYRLAHELDLFYLDNVCIHPDISRVLRISDLKNLLDRLTSTQSELFNAAIANGYVCASPAKLHPLINYRLLQLSNDISLLLDIYTKDELCYFVQKICHSQLPKSRKKPYLINLIGSEYPEVIEQLKVTKAVAVPSIYIRHLLKENEFDALQYNIHNIP